VEEQIQARLADLRRQFEAGQQQLAEQERQQAVLRETMLRISGALQVLEEVLAAQQSVTLFPPVAIGDGEQRP